MGAAHSVDPETLTSERIYEILFELDQTAPFQSFPVDGASTPVTGIDRRLVGPPAPKFQAPPLTDGMEPQPAVVRLSGGNAAPLPEGFALQFVQDRADIDISGAEFNFVRSIRVFDARYVRQHESGRDGDCNRSATIYLGTYGTQGDFSWGRFFRWCLAGGACGNRALRRKLPQHLPSLRFLWNGAIMKGTTATSR